jgi:spermidine synthase
VLELDGDLVDIARDRLGLALDRDLTVDVGDARLALADLPDDSFDVVVGDAFGGEAAPWHLTTQEVMEQVHRVLRPGGVYVMNLIDGGSSDLVRAELATLATTFRNVAVVVPADGVPPDESINQILIASDGPLPDLDLDAADGRIMAGDELEAFVDDATVLTDDHAPVDQLVRG